MHMLKWIQKEEVPPEKKITCPQYSAAYRQEKDNPIEQESHPGDIIWIMMGIQPLFLS